MKRASRYQESLPSESKPKPKRIRRSAKEHNVQARQPPQHHQPTRRSSVYRGVTRHRWTGRYEAHLWDKNCWNQGQNKKGRQVYLGAYDEEEAAAHTYDLAALKYWGPETVLNFPLSTYTKELEEMRNVSREEYLASLRRRSSGFSRGVSKYRGVARHHHNGRWEARIGRVLGNKYLYLGTYSTQEEAATAYDMAAIEYRGMNAVTNFDLSRYIGLLSKTTTKNSNNASSSSDDEQKIEGKQDKNITKSKKIANVIEPKKEYEEEVEKIVEPKQEYEDVQDIKVKVQEDEYENMNKCQPSSPFSDELRIFFGESTGSEHMLCCEPEEMYLNLNLSSNDVNVSMMNGNGENDVGGPSPIFQGLDALCQCDHECSSEQLLEDIVDPFLDAISIPAIPTFPNLAIRTCS